MIGLPSGTEQAAIHCSSSHRRSCVPTLYRRPFEGRSPQHLCDTPLAGGSFPHMAIPGEMTGEQLSRRPSSYNGQDIRMAAPNIDLDTYPEYLKHDCLLYYFPECEALADKIAGISKNVTLGKIRWK